MTDLSQEQQAMRAAIRKKAMIWGIILGLIVAGLVWWLLGSQGTAIRGGGAVLGGFVVGFATLRKSMSSGASSARCGACNAAFSIARSDRVENVIGSETKEEREVQDDGSVEVTSWVEEKVAVKETYTCASCGDNTEKDFETTRRRDEETRTEPAPAEKTAKTAGKRSRPRKSAPPAPKSGGSSNKNK